MLNLKLRDTHCELILSTPNWYWNKQTSQDQMRWDERQLGKKNRAGIWKRPTTARSPPKFWFSESQRISFEKKMIKADFLRSSYFIFQKSHCYSMTETSHTYIYILSLFIPMYIYIKASLEGSDCFLWLFAFSLNLLRLGAIIIDWFLEFLSFHIDWKMSRNGVFIRRRRSEEIDGFGDVSSSDVHVLAVDDSLVDRKVIERLLKITSCKGKKIM